MGMNSKGPEVHAMARQLAARRGTTVTNAARQDDLQALLERFRRLHWPEGVSGQDAQDALYDDHGLPV